MCSVCVHIGGENIHSGNALGRFLLRAREINKNSLDDVLLLHVEARERANAFLAMDRGGRAHEQAAVSAAGLAQLVALRVD